MNIVIIKGGQENEKKNRKEAEGEVAQGEELPSIDSQDNLRRVRFKYVNSAW